MEESRGPKLYYELKKFEATLISQIALHQVILVIFLD